MCILRIHVNQLLDPRASPLTRESSYWAIIIIV